MGMYTKGLSPDALNLRLLVNNATTLTIFSGFGREGHTIPATASYPGDGYLKSVLATIEIGETIRLPTEERPCHLEHQTPDTSFQK